MKSPYFPSWKFIDLICSSSMPLNIAVASEICCSFIHLEKRSHSTFLRPLYKPQFASSVSSLSSASATSSSYATFSAAFSSWILFWRADLAAAERASSISSCKSNASCGFSWFFWTSPSVICLKTSLIFSVSPLQPFKLMKSSTDFVVVCKSSLNSSSSPWYFLMYLDALSERIVSESASFAAFSIEPNSS